MKIQKRVLLVLLISALLSACTRESPPAGTSSSKLLFQFDYTAVQDLLLTKSDPATGDHWSARLRHTAPGPDNWIIESGPPAPDGSHFLDNRANGILIEHLMDTIRTLKVTSLAPKGPLESFGLNPAHFGLRWKADDTEFELLFGAMSNGSTYALVKQQGHGKGSDQVLLLQGAAQQMLTYFSSFAVLRLPSWSTASTDEVDEIELRKSGVQRISAQRDGDQWLDRKGKKRPELQTALEDINHERVQNFIDKPLKAKQLFAAVDSKPLFDFLLKDRHGTPTRLKLAVLEGQVYGTISTRPGAVFELYPKALQTFERLAP